MIDLDGYLESLIAECRSVFGDRLLYVGLQGSYLRGEADEDSDIDVMAIIDRLSVEDLRAYKGILEKIGHADKSCGFICGKDEMMRWSPLDVCHLRHSTKDLHGALADHLPAASRGDAIEHVRSSLGALYHELCHLYVHPGRDEGASRSRGVCKGLTFLIQEMHLLESGTFAATRSELGERVSEEDRAMLMMAGQPEGLGSGEAFSSVFRWCQDAFRRIERMG